MLDKQIGRKACRSSWINIRVSCILDECLCSDNLKFIKIPLLSIFVPLEITLLSFDTVFCDDSKIDGVEGANFKWHTGYTCSDNRSSLSHSVRIFPDDYAVRDRNDAFPVRCDLRLIRINSSVSFVQRGHRSCAFLFKFEHGPVTFLQDKSTLTRFITIVECFGPPFRSYRSPLLSSFQRAASRFSPA